MLREPRAFRISDSGSLLNWSSSFIRGFSYNQESPLSHIFSEYLGSFNVLLNFPIPVEMAYQKMRLFFVTAFDVFIFTTHALAHYVSKFRECKTCSDVLPNFPIPSKIAHQKKVYFSFFHTQSVKCQSLYCVREV